MLILVPAQIWVENQSSSIFKSARLEIEREHAVSRNAEKNSSSRLSAVNCYIWIGKRKQQKILLKPVFVDFRVNIDSLQLEVQQLQISSIQKERMIWTTN
jgi:hypothetical protein